MSKGIRSPRRETAGVIQLTASGAASGAKAIITIFIPIVMAGGWRVVLKGERGLPAGLYDGRTDRTNLRPHLFKARDSREP